MDFWMWAPGNRNVNKLDQWVEQEKGEAQSLENLMVSVEQSLMVQDLRWSLMWRDRFFMVLKDNMRRKC